MKRGGAHREEGRSSIGRRGRGMSEGEGHVRKRGEEYVRIWRREE